MVVDLVFCFTVYRFEKKTYIGSSINPFLIHDGAWRMHFNYMKFVDILYLNIFIDVVVILYFITIH